MKKIMSPLTRGTLWDKLVEIVFVLGVEESAENFQFVSYSKVSIVIFMKTNN